MNEQAENTKKPITGYISIIHSVISQIIVIVSLLFISLVLLSATESGTHWLLQIVFSDIEQLDVKEIKGSLINDLTLKQLHFQDSNDFEITVSEIKLQWRPVALFKGQFHLRKLHLQEVNIKAQAKSEENADNSIKIPKIPLSIIIEQLAVNQLVWHNSDNERKIQQLIIQAKLEDNKLSVSRLILTKPQLKITATSEIALQSDFPLTAKLDWHYVGDQTSLQGQLTINGNIERYNLNSSIKGDIQSSQSGFISLSAEQPKFNLQGKWQKLQWPLSGIAQLESDRGSFQLHGTTQNYRSKINARMNSADYADFSIAYSGNGNKEGIDIEHMLVKPAQGQIDLTGKLSWRQVFNFDLELEVKQLNPTDLGTDIPGILNIKAHSRGSIHNNAINAELTINKLSGKIYQQPVNAVGQIKLANQQLSIEQLKISAGRNWLLANGKVSERETDLDLNIKALDLSTAWPTLTGNLKGHALIQGSLKKPLIKSNIKGHNIRYASNHIGKLSLNADYEHNANRQSRVDFSAKAITMAEHKIEHFTFQGRGNQANHNIMFDFRSALSDIKMNTAGQWNGKQWQGQITQLNIEHPQLKQWQLQSPAILTLTPSGQHYQLELKNTCLIQAKALLCASAQGSPKKKIDTQLSLKDWPLALTKQWLPDVLNLKGMLAAQIKLSSSNQHLTAKANANITQGLAIIKDADNISHQKTFSTPLVQLQYQQDQLNTQIHLGLGKEDFLMADIKTVKDNLTDVRDLSGTVKAQITDMKFIDGLFAEIQQLQGLFFADITLSGTTEYPILKGSAKWQNGQFKIVRLGSSFHNVNFRVNSAAENTEQLILSAEIESEKGKLSGHGQLELLPEHNYPLEMNLTGEQFQLSRLPEAEVFISPSLAIKKNDNLTKITGLIKIDSAQIEIKTLPESAVAPSEDETIIIAETDQTQRQKINPSQLNTDIAIDFGDKTLFSGFGLTTRLTGKLKYITRQQKQNLQGKVIMRNASYRAYGQDLTIRKGKFLFNGPADNPWLNIQAIRKSVDNDVTAVLNVTGPLKSPETRVYSEPVLSESEALSYLVTGKSLKGMSSSNGSAVANAAFNYGAGKLSWLSDSLGIDDFEFKQSKRIEDSAVKLGHYLNPDLYIGITMGLFSNKYAASLRYRLSENFSIGTRAGESQRIDLKYHIKTD